MLLLLITPQTTKLQPQCLINGKVRMEKALNLWVEDMNIKHVTNDGNRSHQKAWTLYDTFSKQGIP